MEKAKSKDGVRANAYIDSPAADKSVFVTCVDAVPMEAIGTHIFVLLLFFERLVLDE